jgi:hypothetical protein
MDHAGDVMSCSMDRAVDHIPGFVDAVVQLSEVGLAQYVAVHIDLDQAGRGDFFVEHPVRIDQERVVLPRYRRRDVIGHHVRHVVVRDQAIARSEVHPGFPLGWRNLVFHRTQREMGHPGH